MVEGERLRRRTTSTLNRWVGKPFILSCLCDSLTPHRNTPSHWIPDWVHGYIFGKNLHEKKAINATWSASLSPSLMPFEHFYAGVELFLRMQLRLCKVIYLAHTHSLTSKLTSLQFNFLWLPKYYETFTMHKILPLPKHFLTEINTCCVLRFMSDILVLPLWFGPNYLLWWSALMLNTPLAVHLYFRKDIKVSFSSVTFTDFAQTSPVYQHAIRHAKSMWWRFTHAIQPSWHVKDLSLTHTLEYVISKLSLGGWQLAIMSPVISKTVVNEFHFLSSTHTQRRVGSWCSVPAGPHTQESKIFFFMTWPITPVG